jgi:hypothetical protein
MMPNFAMGDIFTDAEIKKAGKLYNQYKGTGTLNKVLTQQIVEPVLPRINEQTGQQNSAAYLAYAIEYVLNECKALTDSKQPKEGSK